MIRRAPRALRPCLLAVYWLAMGVGTHWPEVHDFAPQAVLRLPHADKFVHAGLYLGWVLMWVWALSSGGKWVGRRGLAMILAGGAVWAMIDELTQPFCQRQPELSDYLCDLAGLGLGAIAVLLYRRSQAGSGPRMPESVGSPPLR